MAKDEDIQSIRIPLVAESTARNTSTLKDQRFVNIYFEVLENSATGKKNYFCTKRPGTVRSLTPTLGNAQTARGEYSWRGDIYSVYNNTLYRNNGTLGVTLRTSTGMVSFAATRSTASTPTLSVSDGQDLYVISTAGLVTVLNNVAITSSSVANPTVITTATAHGLTTGNQVIIRGHSGSTPSINDTLYTVTVTGASTFTIPVNVTVGGTGGTIGVFPTPNLVDLVYFDGYLFILKSDGSICNCELDDPREWDPTKFIQAIMDNGSCVGLTRQANWILFFGDKWMQGFFNNANATGSPLNNYEQAMQQIGCAARSSIANDENRVTWLGATDTGGYTVFTLSGITEIKDISDPTLDRILNAEATFVDDAFGNIIRVAGHIFYVLTLPTSNRTLVYDYELQMWFEWTGTDGGKFPMVDYIQHAGLCLAQHATDGYLYTLQATIGADNNVGFPVLIRTTRIDLDTNDWKFCKRLALIGEKTLISTPLSLTYTDDDYQTYSTARTLDLVDYNPQTNSPLGRFRRRAWEITYSGTRAFRLEALQIWYRLGLN